MWNARTATIGDATFPYLESGDPQSSHVLLLLHAFPVGYRMWEAVTVPDGWRALAPALPGFDGAPLPPRDSTRIDDYAESISRFMDHLQVDRAVVGGVSMGGYVTFALWRLDRRRCRGLVLADTRAGADSEQARAARETMLETLRTRGTRGVANDMLPKLLGETTRTRHPEVVDRVRMMIERQTPDGLAAAVVRLRDRPDSTPLLRDIDVPVLVVVGEEDVVTPPAEAEQMRAQLPNAHLVRIPDAGHLASLESAAAFETALRQFVVSSLK